MWLYGGAAMASEGIRVDVRLDSRGASIFDTEREILQYFREQARSAINGLVPKITREVQQLIDTALRLSPEWASIENGKLREHFGLADPQSALNDVALAVENSVRIGTLGFDVSNAGVGNPYGSSLGGMNVNILRSNMSEVLNTKGASYTYSAKPKPFANKAGGLVTIPWLQWLLLRGDDIILADVEILTGRFFSGSRSTTAIMVHKTGGGFHRTRQVARGLGYGGNGWQVPPEFSGIEGENWLSRTIEPLSPSIEGIIEAEFRNI